MDRALIDEVREIVRDLARSPNAVRVSPDEARRLAEVIATLEKK